MDKFVFEGINFINVISSYLVLLLVRGMLMIGMYFIGSKVIGNCNFEIVFYGVEFF